MGVFNFFKGKTERQKLEEQYRKLLAESHALSTTNRRQADLKMAEADGVLKLLEALPK